MMKKLLLISMLAACGMGVQAQTDGNDANDGDEVLTTSQYESMFKVGKCWKYEQTRRTNKDEKGVEPIVDTTYVDLVVVGDTIIDGGACWRINKVVEGESELFAFWKEEERKVYKQRADGTWTLLFDFTPVKNTPLVTLGNGYYLDSIDVIVTDGRSHHRYWYANKNDSWKTPLCMEGMGTRNGIWNVEGLIAGFDAIILRGVYEDGERIFTPNDFYRDGVADGIEPVVAHESAMARGDGAVHDLQGRRVSEKGKVNSTKLPRGVYIQNGKKFVAK